jgi:O-antigen ligase
MNRADKIGSNGLVASVSRITWALFLIALPVTSFPFFPDNIGGGTLVRPLSLYPLLILMILVILPRLFLKPLPRTILSFLPFVIVVFATTILALSRNIEGLQGVSVIARMVRALATLGIGGAIYLTVALWPTSQGELKASLRWLYAGFVVALAWGTLQAFYIIYYSPDWFNYLSAVQEWISIRRLFSNRVSGMTYEPNWFADQISLLLLPWLLAAVLSKTTVFRWRRRWLTIELLLLIWSLVLLPFTFSRAGLVIASVVVFIGVLFFRGKKFRQEGELDRSGFIQVRRVVEGVLLMAILAGVTFFAGSRNEFFARVWEYWRRSPDQGYVKYIFDYFEYLGFGARFTYWDTGANIYNDNPLIGVGLGNYAFYFEEYLPDRSLALQPEVLRLIVPDEGRNRLITSKNFYIRLLAETGLLGAATFLAFVMAILGCAMYLWYTNTNRFWGIGSLLGLLAFGLAAFSFDSFAIPNVWVVFGLITSAANLSWKSLDEADVGSLLPSTLNSSNLS